MTTTWQQLLAEHAGPALLAVAEDRERGTVYPPAAQMFRAFELTPFEKVRVVVIGQDPYSGFVACPYCHEGFAVTKEQAVEPCPRCDGKTPMPQADGLAFSVSRGVPIPPSLRNVFKELERSAPLCPSCAAKTTCNDMCSACDWTGNAWGWRTPDHGDLTVWAERGVLLINSALSVHAGVPGSHAKVWGAVTQALLRELWTQRKGLVWMLWGGAARRTMTASQPYIDFERGGPNHFEGGGHLTLSAPHPADRRKGIVGSNCFVEANRWLAARGEPEIDWRVDP